MSTHNARETCPGCGPYSDHCAGCPSRATDDRLLTWGRFPLGTTLWLRERFRAYREKPGAPDA